RRTGQVNETAHGTDAIGVDGDSRDAEQARHLARMGCEDNGAMRGLEHRGTTRSACPGLQQFSLQRADESMRGGRIGRAVRGDEIERVRIEEERPFGLSALAYQPFDDLAGCVADADTGTGD